VIERWSKWAHAEADRIDPVKSARFLEGIGTDDNTNSTWGGMWGFQKAIEILLYIQ
jgi:hypothetical protein